MKRAVVLSGGGSQGAYQIGVWRALKKMHISYDIVTGTSVGAMNGALMVQRDYLKGIWMWYHLNFNQVFDEKMNGDYYTKAGKKEIIKTYAKNIFLNGGMDVSKLEETLNRGINLKKFYKSNIDFGLVMVKLPGLKPVMLTKKQIPRYQLKDYIMASATCFPAFKKKQIQDSSFIDGGYYDNLPINLAIDMGAEEIIAVDLSTIGVRRRVKKTGIKITYITPRNNLGSFLVFHKELARRNIKFGYNDAMKTYKKLDGNKYTFKYGHLERNLNRYQHKMASVLDLMFNYSKQSKSILDKLLKITNYYQIINGNREATKRIINTTLENTGKIFELDEANIYDINNYNRILIEKNNLIDNIDAKLIEQKIKNSDIISLLNTKLTVKYIYNKMLVMENDDKIKKELCRIALILSKEFMSALYIFVVNKQNNKI
jgi:NTE family protein